MTPRREVIRRLLRQALDILEAVPGDGGPPSRPSPDGETFRVRSGNGGTFTVTVKPDRPMASCNKWGHPVLWAKTGKGRDMPLDYNPDSGGVYVSHFATCGKGLPND